MIFSVVEKKLFISDIIVQYSSHHSLKQFIRRANFVHYMKYQGTAITLTCIDLWKAIPLCIKSALWMLLERHRTGDA